VPAAAGVVSGPYVGFEDTPSPRPGMPRYPVELALWSPLALVFATDVRGVVAVFAVVLLESGLRRAFAGRPR
jgi:hypothetical protein